MRKDRPLIVGIAGTTRQGSLTERLVSQALGLVEAAGADTRLFGSQTMMALPFYGYDVPMTPEAADFVTALRRCDGVVIGSPGYHGSISGLVKNALDWLEELRGDERPYLDGRTVGLVVTAHGAQACGTTLMTLRSIVHALRGWPTPMGVALNASIASFDEQGRCIDDATVRQLSILAHQVLGDGAPSACRRKLTAA